METLARQFRELTKAAFARHGFAYAELLAQWPAIVGAEIAGLCEIERVRWPRGQGGGNKTGGTLHVRAAPGRGLDIQHVTQEIVERINGYHGYGAIARVKVAQGSVGERHAMSQRQTDGADAGSGFTGELVGITDTALKAALSRLGQGALRHEAGSPQQKRIL